MAQKTVAQQKKKKAPPQRTLIQEEILKALETSIERAPLGLGYRIGLSAVGLLMLLMPLIYLGLVALVGHSIWWNVQYIKNLPPRESSFLNIVFIVFASITIIFLIKPIFSSWDKGARPIRLKRNVEPFLFDYVEAICDAVNAPYPKSIRVDCQPNASAGPRKGLISLLRNDLTLTIGLPFVSGLTIRQFTGVMAHEFGHFSQGYGMKFSTATRMLNHWFLRAAYERDNWDDMLVGTSHALPIRLAIFVYAARFFVWIARKLIAAVGLIGHSISCFMLREMEYDADRYETRMCGSRTFESTCNEITYISVANAMAMNDLQSFYREGRLADDLPALISSNITKISKDLKDRFHKDELDQKTGWFDSHPTNRDRIESAKAENTEGVFQPPLNYGDLPASLIFHDYARISRAITLEHYKALLEEDFDKSKITDTSRLIGQREAENQAGESLDRYFQVHIPIMRPLRLSEDVNKPPENPKQALQALKESRTRMLELVDEYEKLTKCQDEADTSWLLATEAQALVDAGMSFRAKDFRMPSSRKKSVKGRVAQTEAAVQHLGARMLDFETAAEERISYALQLLQVPKVEERVPNGEAVKLNILNLIPDAKFISKLMTKLPELRSSYRILGTLCSQLDNQERPLLFNAIDSQIKRMHQMLTRLKERMSQRMYPFDHHKADTTLDEYALPVVPDNQDLFGIVHVTSEMVDRLAGVQLRLYAQLAQAAEHVEKAVGLPPLEVRQRAEEVDAED